MMRTAIAIAMLLLVQGAASAMLLGSSPWLPDWVAAHFDAGGQPDGWMSKGAYLWTMAAFGVALPLFIVFVFFGVRWFPTTAINLPHREYWLAADHRAETLSILLRAGLWLASMLTALACGLNLLVVAANQAQPVRLSFGVWALLGAFLVATVVWGVSFYLRFMRTG